MPNNYIIGSDTDSEEVILKKIASARETLKQIVGEILRKERVYRVHEGAMAGVKSYAANAGFNRFARSARPFFATDRCNGCGLCAQRCPASAISMKDGETRVESAVLPVPALHQRMPQAGHPVWQRHRRAAAVYHLALSSSGGKSLTGRRGRRRFGPISMGGMPGPIFSAPVHHGACRA